MMSVQTPCLWRFLWRFPSDHPALPGHFPGQPIAPGVVLLDALLLSAAKIPGYEHTLWRFPTVKFLATVKGGEELSFVFEQKSEKSFEFKIQTTAEPETLVAQGTVSVTP